MSTSPFSADDKQRIVEELQRYVQDELGHELGRFDAEFLLDFVVAQVEPHVYNRAVRDAQAVLAARIDDVQDAILQLERPVDPRR